MEIARKYIELNQSEMEFESPKIMLCNLLKRMDKSDESLKFLQQFLKNPGNENIAHIYNRIGLILRDEKKYEAALEYFEKAFNLCFYTDSSQQKYAAFVLHNQGTVYAKMKQLNKAWGSQWRGLQILDSMGYVDSHWRALFYRSIGRICLYRNKFDKAMKFYIATIYFYQHQYNEALLYHLQALEIRQKYLVPNNHEIAWSLHHVGKTYYKMGDLEKSLEYYLEYLKNMRRSTSILVHESHISLLDDIILAYGNEYEKTLEYSLKAIEIVKEFKPVKYWMLIKYLE
ncbi:unnamed protein product [Adineta steineri]|uniref:Tetratricopeptide repeat protein n=1 Tax=Adineta steineri TaxID=433720 RepID=A0A813WWT8_9BILA|nr:unnamed protein product [Adineta steineri]